MSAVLLIEDNEDNRRSKMKVLKLMAGRGPVIAVEGSDEAIRAVRALPRFDLIVADINLPHPGDRHGEDNRDGISFARWLHRTGYPALLTGYSAHFGEDQVSRADRDLFHDFLGRGAGPTAIGKAFGDWLEEADKVRENLRRTPRAKVSRSGSSEEERISFGEGVISVDVIDLTDERAIRELLDEGFAVKLARPTGGHKHGRPFFVWFRELDNEGAFVEVFGQPFLYAEAPSLEQAEAQLGVLMTEIFEDLRHEDELKLGRPMIDLRNFLQEVFSE